MKILSIVTLVSPDGEYGGPVRVAVNQARELRSRGHDVTICGGARGYDSLPTEIDGIPAKLFPVHTAVPRTGFAGLASPSLWAWLARHSSSVDICHIHAARDLVTLPAALIARARNVPYILQTHGMIDPSGSLLAGVLDKMATRRLLRDAKRVLYLNEVERDGVIAVGGEDLRLVELPNGVPEAREGNLDQPDEPEVLFLARIAPRKRPTLFAKVADSLAAEFPQARFTLVGPDEGEGESVRRIIAGSAHSDRISWEGPLAPEATLDRMRRASIYVLPSIDEPYPMSVLEAMSVGLPIIITESCGLATIVKESGSGLVVDHSADGLRQAVAELLQEPEGTRSAGARGRDYVRDELSMTTIGNRLLDIYQL